MLSVHDDAGIRTIMDELMAASKNPAAGMRRVRNLLSVLTQPKKGHLRFASQIIFYPELSRATYDRVRSGHETISVVHDYLEVTLCNDMAKAFKILQYVAIPVKRIL